MSKNSSQNRQQASTHYHDAARQHQEAAHLGKHVVSNDARNVQKTRASTANRRSSAKTRR